MFYINNKIIQFKNHIIKYVKNNVNPLNLPPNTIRVKFASGYTPTMGDTQTLVDANNNVWDIYKSSNDWSNLFNEEEKEHVLLKVLGANTSNVTQMTGLFRCCKLLTTVLLFDTSNVTKMPYMFYKCTSLTTVPLFDTANVTAIQSMFYQCTSLISVPLFNTSNVTAIQSMFYQCTSLTTVPLFDTSNVITMGYMLGGCTSLTSIPLFNTSKVTGMTSAFYNCKKVQSGALALYQQASTQANPPTNHSGTFYNCGSNTQTGRAELAQIPSDWKG